MWLTVPSTSFWEAGAGRSLPGLILTASSERCAPLLELTDTEEAP
jgi:hypothetical protein